MRFYEGDRAYEVERVLDPTTQLYSGWRFNVIGFVPASSYFAQAKPRLRKKQKRRARRPLLR